jgi:transmembrane sensor
MERHNALRQKVQNKTATRDERIEYFQALLHGEHDDVTLSEARDLWDAPADATPEEQELIKQIYQNVDARTRDNVRPLYTRPTWIAVAAATVFMFAIAGFWLYDRTNSDPATTVAVNTTSITGPDYIILPDLSKIELMAGSTLEYGEGFGTAHRFLKLSGTAFFDVTHNPEIPFKVLSGRVLTTVLGTAFNISEDSKFVEVTVVRGKVSVGDEKSVFELIEPNEKIVVDTKYMGFAVRHTNAQQELAWKANNIIFNDMPINEVIAKLEQRFKVDIEIANDALNSCEVNVWFTKGNETLSDILTPICVLYDAQLVRKGNKIVIEGGKGCNDK